MAENLYSFVVDMLNRGGIRLERFRTKSYNVCHTKNIQQSENMPKDIKVKCIKCGKEIDKEKAVNRLFRYYCQECKPKYEPGKPFEEIFK